VIFHGWTEGRRKRGKKKKGKKKKKNLLGTLFPVLFTEEKGGKESKSLSAKLSRQKGEGGKRGKKKRGRKKRRKDYSFLFFPNIFFRNKRGENSLSTITILVTGRKTKREKKKKRGPIGDVSRERKRRPFAIVVLISGARKAPLLHGQRGGAPAQRALSSSSLSHRKATGGRDFSSRRRKGPSPCALGKRKRREKKTVKPNSPLRQGREGGNPRRQKEGGKKTRVICEGKEKEEPLSIPLFSRERKEKKGEKEEISSSVLSH